ncbi:UNVERIFIED_CONTAM: hypothetical protein Scaly_0907200 [Sesamum calycinum]|uniref:Uncharacterized protein n=1 Tax=Sesamum calycinum TaxID=2727403 RepID=A0AAW2QX61_9LAMI
MSLNFSRWLLLLFAFLPANFLLLSSTPFPFSLAKHFSFPITYDHTFQALTGESLSWPWGTRTERLLYDNSTTTEQQQDQVDSTDHLVLAPRRTYRKDPLNHFKRYTGGWNITNPHYWASVSYTAVPFFAIAAIWFAVFGLCLSLICLCYCCCPREPYGYSRIAYALSLLFLISFMVATMRLTLIILSAVMLGLTFLGLVFSLFGMQLLVYILVISGWILVTATFILCGIFLLLHNVTGDTCIAMKHWVQNPTAHTALDDILPCVDKTTAQDTLNRSKEVTSQLVNVINTVISNVSNINFAPNFVPLYYNQSGPLVPTLCNPFNPDLTDRECAPGEVDLNNATEVWSGYVCQTSPSGICVTTGRLNPTLYDQMAATVNVSYGLYQYSPFLVELEDCSFVRQTFLEIDATYCPGLGKYSQRVYVGLVMVATAVMLSLVFWVIYGRERRHRLYTKAHTPAGEEGNKHAE